MNYTTMAKAEVIRLLNAKLTVSEVEQLLAFYPHFEQMATKLDRTNSNFTRLIAMCENVYNVNHNDNTSVSIPALPVTSTASTVAPTVAPAATNSATTTTPAAATDTSSENATDTPAAATTDSTSAVPAADTSTSTSTASAATTPETATSATTPAETTGTTTTASGS